MRDIIHVIAKLIVNVFWKRFDVISVNIKSTDTGTFITELIDIIGRYYKRSVFITIVSGLTKHTDSNNVIVSQIIDVIENTANYHKNKEQPYFKTSEEVIEHSRKYLLHYLNLSSAM